MNSTVSTWAPALDRLDHRLAAVFVLDELEGALALGADLEGAVLLRIDHQERIVEEVLGHRHLGFLEVEDERLLVLHLDGVGVPQLGRHHHVALVVLLAGVDLLEHVALHQADDRGADIGIEAVLDVPGGIFGRPFAAVVPGRVRHGERPGLEIGRGFPLRSEMRPGDVVGAGAGEIAAGLAHDVGVEDPGERVRIVDLGHPHGDLDGAALGQILRQGRRRERLAGDLARPHVGGARGHAEQRRITNELAAVISLSESCCFSFGIQTCSLSDISISSSQGVFPGADAGRPVASHVAMAEPSASFNGS